MTDVAARSGADALAVDAERRSRVALSFLAPPGDPLLGAALRLTSAAHLLAAITGEAPDDSLGLSGHLPDTALARAMSRWRVRLGQVPGTGRLAEWERCGLRLVFPGDAEWPAPLDDLGDARPLVLWVRGAADLRSACLSAVAVVGARAASAYGSHVAVEMAASLAEHGIAVISGGAYGIDAGAHRGTLAAGGVTVAVLAGGLEFGYPRGHGDLFRRIAAEGALVSECPPDSAPTRPGFLVRNRIIAALSHGTVVVEAALRSGALNTARHARELCRPVMAVPGPVTSEFSAGCHELIRDYGAMCVTSAVDVLAHLGLAAAEPSPGDLTGGLRLGPGRPRDGLDPITAAVLEEVPARGGRGPASIAVRAGVTLDETLRCLGVLAVSGFVERTDRGWRTR